MRRTHAGYFRSNARKYKQRDELFVLEKLLEAMAILGETEFHSPQINNNDPPDCVALNLNGETIAFEVTELVDVESVGRNPSDQYQLKFWNEDEVISYVNRIIESKDYHYRDDFYKVVLIIFTDEYLLMYKDFAQSLKSYAFPKLNHIDEIFFLFSYDPNEGDYCPYVRLKTKKCWFKKLL